MDICLDGSKRQANHGHELPLKQTSTTKRLSQKQIHDTLHHRNGVGEPKDDRHCSIGHETMRSAQITQILSRCI